MDDDKPAEISIYSFEMIFGGDRYGGEIPARSPGEAQAWVGKFGGKLVGRKLAEQQEGICSICGGDFPLVDKESPLPIDGDEWPDEL